MAEENVELVRRCFDLFLARDLAELETLIHADVVLDLSRRVFNPAIYRGFEDLRRFVGEADETWDAFTPRLEEVLGRGDVIVATTRLTGTGPGSGARTEMQIFQIWEIREGKVARLTGGYLDRSDRPAGRGARGLTGDSLS